MTTKESAPADAALPTKTAIEATRNVHTMHMIRSGYSALGDIPLQISISTISGKGRLATRAMNIRPDSARLLDTRHVSDDLYREIHSDNEACTEGEGAEKLNRVLEVLCGQVRPQDRRPVRYSLNVRHENNLIRNWLWREGYSWQQAEGGRNRFRAVNLQDALIILAGISRTMELERVLPKPLRNFDLEKKSFSPEELCSLYNIDLPGSPGSCAPSSALLRLVIQARTAEYTPPSDSETGRNIHALRGLGSIIDHLEGIAGIRAADNIPGDAKRRARQLIVPLRPGAELEPADVGLMWRDGEWLAVVQPQAGMLQKGSYQCMCSLPEGEPILRNTYHSAPLARMDLLASDHGWDNASDERLKKLCRREGEAFSFQVLKEAFTEISRSWAPPESNFDKDSEKTTIPNPWVGIYTGWPQPQHYEASRAVAHLINKACREGSFDQAAEAMKKLEESARGARGNALTGIQKLIKNMSLVASRANLPGYGRSGAWLKHMTLLPDSNAWPGGHSPIEEISLHEMLYGDGDVASHNAAAVAARKSAGISAHDTLLTKVTTPPRGGNGKQAQSDSQTMREENEPQGK